ncbi:signal transduction histidine kinase [Pseudonocardia sediminis]|uniref:histidine kinase n=1 Tax=Pseudonocardia sediminis TaxID=1397368 RepID=A0A4V2FQS5_PSEST|nr:histidine kinase [Pseudonocardia sediminis]RZT85850.1 signal transduction histidine kinase [Pseudonocardia sediminis]
MSPSRPDAPASAEVSGWPDRLGARFDERLTRLGLTGEFRRDAALAVVVAVVSTGLIAVLVTVPAAAIIPGLTPFQTVTAIVVTAVQSLLLCLRRVHPVLCLAGIVALEVPLVAVLPAGQNLNGLAVFVAAYTCGTRLSARRTAEVLVVAALLEAIGFAVLNLGPALRAGSPLVEGGPPLTTAALWAVLAGHLASTLLTFGAGAMIGAYVATRRRYVDLVRVRAAEAVEAQRARADAAIGQERSRMARELHDIAAHHLSGMVVQAAVVERLIDRDPQAAKEAAAWVRGQGKETLHNLRLVVGALRGSDDDALDDGAPVPGLGVLDALVGTARDLGTPVELVREGEPPELPPIADVTFYRVAQEALANARDHAPGAPVRVLLRDDGTAVVLDVVNEASGTRAGAPAEHRGLGLVGMRERAQMIGASWEAGEIPSGGWRVRLSLPSETPSPETLPSDTLSSGALPPGTLPSGPGATA